MLRLSECFSRSNESSSSSFISLTLTTLKTHTHFSCSWHNSYISNVNKAPPVPGLSWNHNTLRSLMRLLSGPAQGHRKSCFNTGRKSPLASPLSVILLNTSTLHTVSSASFHRSVPLTPSGKSLKSCETPDAAANGEYLTWGMWEEEQGGCDHLIQQQCGGFGVWKQELMPCLWLSLWLMELQSTTCGTMFSV